MSLQYNNITNKLNTFYVFVIFVDTNE